jgi:hypothetical protein
MVTNKYGDNVKIVEMNFTNFGVSATSGVYPNCTVTSKFVRGDGDEYYPSTPTLSVDLSTYPASATAWVDSARTFFEDYLTIQYNA